MIASCRLLMHMQKVWILQHNNFFFGVFFINFSISFPLIWQNYSIHLIIIWFKIEIGAKKLDLTEFVEALGPFLTSTDVDIRAKAMRLLSATLTNLSTDFLNSIQLNFITTFYCDRLKDHHSVVPSTLSGIEALIKMTNLPDECAARLLQAIFQNVPCQSQVREDRTKIFNIISELCKTKTSGKVHFIVNSVEEVSIV